MATGLIEFRSAALARPAKFRFVCPNDVPPFMVGANPHYQRPMKTLYLLHGFNAGCMDWMEGSDVGALARQYNLMIFFPEGDNSFYLDRPGTGRKYATFIGKELVDYTRKMFTLSEQKEDTFIGGYSMGGFGALHTALTYPDTFGKVFALSSALIIHNVANMQPGTADAMADYDYYFYTFGDPKQVLESSANPEYLIKRLLNQGKALPEIYMAIGTEDFLYTENQVFRNFLTENHVRFTYEEGPGTHDFGFWSPYCAKGIAWLLGE